MTYPSTEFGKISFLSRLESALAKPSKVRRAFSIVMQRGGVKTITLRSDPWMATIMRSSFSLLQKRGMFLSNYNNKQAMLMETNLYSKRLAKFVAGLRLGRPQTISSPTHSPRPRTSPIQTYFSIKSFSPSIRTFPTILADWTSFSLATTSKTAIPIAHATGFPPC